MVVTFQRGRSFDYQQQSSFSDSTFGSSISSCFYDMDDSVSALDEVTPLPYKSGYSIDYDFSETTTAMPAVQPTIPYYHYPQQEQQQQQQLPSLPSTTASYQQPTTASYQQPAMPTTAPFQQSLFIEVHSGFCIEFRSVDETWQAVQEGRTATTKCSCCERQLKSLPDAEFVLCPLCRFIGLVGNTAPQTNGRGGLSLGFADERSGKEAGVAALHHLRNSWESSGCTVPNVATPPFRH